ncbi:hypothetical protein [Pseudomonas sp. NPDC089401]|uniref:hypothetical protein n=1 Tax=Pseudomonas sp. NPDC089401 TaxID=3364462 RepID=UPI003828B767
MLKFREDQGNNPIQSSEASMITLGELQHRWAAGQLIGLDILCQCSGFATEIDIEAVENSALTHAFGWEYRFSQGRTKA